MPAAKTLEATEINFAPPIAETPSAVPAVVETAPLPAASEAETLSQAIIRMASDPRVDIDKLERLIKMQERAQDRVAEIEFNNAMASAQEEMKPIRANMENEHTKSEYADQAALDRAIRPIYTKHGFSLSFRHGDGAPPDHTRILCKLGHRGGHVEWPHYDIPVDGKGARGNDVMTKTHASGASATYGKRYLLGMIFNLAVARDDDGNGAGGLDGGDDVESLAPKNAPRDANGKLLSTYNAERAKQAQQWADEAIQYLNMVNARDAQEWRREKQKVPQGKRKSPLQWLADNSPGQYVRVQQCYQNVTGEDLE
jgi:hypothetical protein